ncbi:MAG: hypothetical protein J6W99_02600 [Bacteroidaceae bacterium]|nr:hypothetical protein [Bacteroidaceae bacterium]
MKYITHFSLITLLSVLLMDSCVSARYAGYGTVSIANIEGNSTIENASLTSTNERISISYDMKKRTATIRNNSDGMMYVDKALSHYINNNGIAQPLFSNTVTTVTGATTNSGSVNLGPIAGALGIGGVAGSIASGINVGSASTSGVSVQQYEQQVLIIPPHGAQTISLPQPTSTHKVGGNKPFTNEYTPTNSIFSCDFSFTYAINDNNVLENYTQRDKIYLSEEQYTHGIKKRESKQFQLNHDGRNTFVDGTYFDVGIQYGAFLGGLATYVVVLAADNIFSAMLLSGLVMAAPQIFPFGYNTKRYYYPLSINM